jgi:hypothetical protein
MGFFDLFKKSNQVQDTLLESKKSLPESKGDDLTNHGELMKGDITTYSIEFGTRLPIDIIYEYLQEDIESKAYQDALTSPDRSYKETNLAIIRSNLEVRFKQVTLKYEDMLRDIDFHIQSRGEAGLTDIVELLKSRKAIYGKHLEELRKMKADLDNGELYMTGLFKSYEVGFTRGLASISLHNLKSDNKI